MAHTVYSFTSFDIKFIVFSFWINLFAAKNYSMIMDSYHVFPFCIVINMETFPKRIQMHVDSDYYIRHAPDDEQTEKG